MEVELIYQLTTRYACGGLIVINGIVVECAPIFKKWAIGKRIVDIYGVILVNEN